MSITRASICLLAVLFSACSHAVEVPALPHAAFPDTEVSTNFTFGVGAVANRRLVFTLELQASPSNNVEVAIGCDADGDGHLSLEESGLAVGYDCGEWFVRSAEKDTVTSEAVSDAGTFRRVCEVRSQIRGDRPQGGLHFCRDFAMFCEDIRRAAWV